MTRIDQVAHALDIFGLRRPHHMACRLDCWTCRKTWMGGQLVPFHLRESGEVFVAIYSRIQDAKCMNISQNTVKRQCWCGSTFVQPSKARWWYLVHLGHVNEFRSVRQNDLSIHKTRTKTDQWPKNGWGIKKIIIGIKKIREDQKKIYGDQKIFQMLKISMILKVLLLDTRVLVRWMFESVANTMVEVEQIQSRAALRSSASWIHAWRANVAGTR